MPVASPSRPPRSSRKRIGTRAWKSGTPSIRNTASPATRATARSAISKPFANMARRPSIAIPLRPCAIPSAGPRERPKLRFLSRFRGISLPGKFLRRLFIPVSPLHSNSACFVQLILHSRHALARRFFRGARALPVRFEAHGSGVPRLHQGAELPDVIDDAPAHRRPFVRAIRVAHDIFAMHMPDAFLGDFIEPVRKSDLATIGRIPGIPVQFEVRRLHGLKGAHGLGAGRGVAAKFVFEKKSDLLRGDLSGGVAKFAVYRIAERLGIVQSPEIEATDAVRAQRLGGRDGAFQHLFLLRETVVRAKLRRLGAVFRSGCSGPVRFEKRAGDVGYLKTKFSQEPPYFGGFLFIEVNDVLVPRASQLDVTQAELFRSYFQGVTEVLSDLIGDDRKLEPAAHCRHGRGIRARPAKERGCGCTTECHEKISTGSERIHEVISAFPQQGL